MAGYINIDAAIQVSRKAQFQKAKILEEINMVRTDLRHAVRLGGATEEQRKYVLETYPNVKRTRKAK